jgi:CheY-like chemotaxis protein
MQDQSTARSFLGQVRWALYHLYEPGQLRQSALVDWLDLGGHADPSSALRDQLTAAIEALKPDLATPEQSAAWRSYHILYQHYVERFAQKEVATDLALSVRQLRRHEALALRTLADLLARRADAPASPALVPQEAKQSSSPPGPSREDELAWLQKTSPSLPVAVHEIVAAVLETAQPMLQAEGVQVQAMLPAELPCLAVPPMAVRQALLSSLLAVAHGCRGRPVQISAEATAWQVQLAVRADVPPTSALHLSAEDNEMMAIARQLVGLSGGSLELSFGPQGRPVPQVRLQLPAAEQIRVLIIDDNTDTLKLYQRYLARTRYRFVGLPEPAKALTAIEDAVPDLIVLDVMLPDVDGWQLLGRLREHPRTAQAPLIVATILPHEQLALTLGAAAFLRKPVSRADFLAALDRQVSLLLKGSPSRL